MSFSYSRSVAALFLLPTLLLAQTKPATTPAPTPAPGIAPSPTHQPATPPAVTKPTPAPTPVPTATPAPNITHAYPATGELPTAPWKDGEALTYHATWGIVDAATGTFVTRSDGPNWSLNLTLESIGSIHTMYPFKDSFTSTINQSPWRSLSYAEDRHEPNRIDTDVTQVNYTTFSAARVLVDKSKGTENHNYTFTTDALDDLGSVLLHLRAMHWSVGEKHMLYVYENNSAKEGEATCEAIETRAFGTWPSQSLLRIHAVPGKGTHRHGYLTFWMTNDSRRLPLHADLNFYYGTFGLDLTKFDILPKITPPPPPKP